VTDFEQVRTVREHCLRQAFQAFRMNATPTQRAEIEAFRHEQAGWLDDYALFAALKQQALGRPWTQWNPDLVMRKSAALQHLPSELAGAMDEEAFIQFQFSDAVAATSGVLPFARNPP